MNTAVIETISIPWNMEVKTGNYTQDYEDKNEVVSSRVVTTQYWKWGKIWNQTNEQCSLNEIITQLMKKW